MHKFDRLLITIYLRWLEGFEHLMEQVNISWIFLNFAMSGVDMEDASEKGHLFRVRRNFGRNGTKKIQAIN